MKIKEKTLRKIRVKPGSPAALQERDPGCIKIDGTHAEGILKENAARLAHAQEILYASGTHGILIVLQGMDASGKDGTISHVMSGVNPQGCDVYSFKQPSTEELKHTFLWRYQTKVPERGRIVIFNRSYYEDVLVTRVHPELLESQNISIKDVSKKFWEKRFKDINAFERHLVRNGIVVLKFFLHISKEEQRRRLLARLDDKNKLWKFSRSDLKERAYWKQYAQAYESAIAATSTKSAPWNIIPADHKWGARVLIGEIITQAVAGLDLKYPQGSKELLGHLSELRRELSGGK